jgi:Rieske Fe-S protein
MSSNVFDQRLPILDRREFLSKTLKSAGVSTCPCHSSKFNTGGAVIEGPATSGLKQYSATIDGDVVTIK